MSNARGAPAEAVILDRDGTIVVDRGYLADPAGLEFLPHAAEGLRMLYSAGYRLVVITNQSGVGRGMFPVECLHAMNARLEAMVREAGARLDGIYWCPHAPDSRCACRKPAQALLIQAARDLNFDAAAATVIGDKMSDVEFGRRAGAATILIAPVGVGGGALGGGAGSSAPDATAPDLVAAARVLPSLRSMRRQT
jgi:D-glycero-D-manno-heptose 1,7-bisphosphate phosphatase